MTKYLLALTALLLFTACSSTVYKPEVVMGKKDITTYSEKKARADHLKALTFDNGTVLMRQGVIQGLKIPKGYALINSFAQGYLAADLSGNVMVLDKNGTQKALLSTTHRVLSVSLADDTLALVDATNTMKIYTFSNKKLKFTFSGSQKSAVDMRLANPIFYEGIIFFPTLDGKVQLYSTDKKKMLKTISVSTEDNFNNIIFFAIKDKKVYAATATALYLFGTKAVTKKLPISHVYFDGDHLVVLTKNGIVSEYDEDLKEQKSLKLSFARYLGAVFKHGMVYVLENEGYMIKIYPDFKNYNVYAADFDHKTVFTGQDRFYFSNGFLAVP